MDKIAPTGAEALKNDLALRCTEVMRMNDGSVEPRPALERLAKTFDERIEPRYRHSLAVRQTQDDAMRFVLAAQPPAAAEADKRDARDACRLVTERMVQSALEAGWNEFVSDTGCYPACFEVQRGKRIEADFQRAEGAFLEYIAASLNAAMSASKTAPEQSE